MERPLDKIRLVILKGSVRPGNYTSMAAALVEDELKQHPRVSVETIDPAQLDLPLPGTASRSNELDQLRRKVAAATGVVLATPEYHGSYSSVMKLLIENFGHPSPLFAKPVALLGVAGGTIGAIKALEHLRSVVSHIGGIVLPLPISVANVQRVFDEQGRCLDPDAERLIRSVATNLLQYIEQNVCPRVMLERLQQAERKVSPHIVGI
ncbi:MAG TPA: NAD(P)H-dependent oxidoreductase [Nitrospiraceae bacterium]|nr:NAD(P)H-dependent oxidoreductase [Nitrospiraceae bacterium]